MVEHNIFGTCMCGGEMATRGNGPPHDHHRSFRGVLEAQMDVVGGLHVYANRPGDKRARNNKKKVKTGKSASTTKVPKNRKEGKQHKNSEKKHRKENKKTEQATKHSAIVPTSQKQERSRRKQQQTVWNGEL